MTPSDLEYMARDRLARYHLALLEQMPPCHHGTGANRAYPQDGCPRCYSLSVIERCTADIEIERVA